MEGSCYGLRSCQSAQLKSPLCLGLPGYNVWAPMYKIPDFGMLVRQSLLELLGYWELCIEGGYGQTRLDIKMEALPAPPPSGQHLEPSSSRYWW